MCSSDAPFCQYSVEVLVSITFGSLSSPRISAPVANGNCHLGETVILVPRAGARGLAEFGVEEHPADAGDMGEHAIEHARARFVAVEALGEVIAQIASGLRDAEAQRMRRLTAEQVASGRAVAQDD